MTPVDDHSGAPAEEDAEPLYVFSSPEEEAAFRAAVREGIADADAGRLISGEAVLAWLRSWGTENELPPPKCGD